MDRRVILLNGVPSSGKDTIASYLSNHFNYNHRYIAKYLVDLAIEISGVSRYDWENRYADRIKNTKELPWDKLNGLSQRQFLRIISEDWIKPVFGLDYFAKKEILTSTKKSILETLVNDSGATYNILVFPAIQWILEVSPR